MRKSRSLQRLQSAFNYRVVRLERVAREVSDDKASAYVAIEALNAWASFARQFYLSCTWLQAITIKGLRATPGGGAFADERQALLFAIQRLKPNVSARAAAGAKIDARYEPNWHSKDTIIQLSSTLALSNDSSVVAAFSYPTRFFDDAPVVRNFFAHRNMGTADKVRRLARQPPYLLTAETAHDFVRSLLPGRPQTVVAEWLEDLRLVSDEICQ